MSESRDMSESRVAPIHDFGALPLVKVLDAISSAEPSSGAGAAAAVALALAVACALKAVNVTLKHRADAKLIAARERLVQHRELALDRARVDAELFERYLASHEPRDVARLVVAGEDFHALSREIGQEIEQVGDAVLDSVRADIAAAQALLGAAVAIEARILHDERRLRAHLP